MAAQDMPDSTPRRPKVVIESVPENSAVVAKQERPVSNRARLRPDPQHRVYDEPGTDTMTKAEALAATAKLKSYISCAWELLLEVQARRGHVALGYSTFAEYCRTELDVSRSRAYQLIDMGKVTLALAEAAGVVSTDVDITEAQARDIKPMLESVTAEVAERIADGEDPEVVIPEVVDAVRQGAASMADAKAVADSICAGPPRGQGDDDARPALRPSVGDPSKLKLVVNKPRPGRRPTTGSLDDRWQTWLKRMQSVMAQGYDLAAETERDAVVLGGHSAMALMLYRRMGESQMDAELRQIIDRPS